MTRLVGIALAAAMLLAGAPAAFAEHLPEGQSSPCRPNAPAGESTLGYSDQGPQDDPQRQLPTIYYNDTGQYPYIGACGGGSDGEPIRYIEIRLTPAGPYLYGSDTTSGTPLARCAPGVGAVGRGVGPTCAETGIPADARDISAEVSTETTQEFDGDDGILRERTGYRLSVTQDRVALQKDDATIYDYGFPPDRFEREFFVERDEASGRIELGERFTESGQYEPGGTCTVSVSATMTDPGSVTTTSDDPNEVCPEASVIPFAERVLAGPVDFAEAVVAAAEEWRKFLLARAGEAVDALPDGPPGPSNCRQYPRPGEQSMALPGSAVMYWNTAAANPYAGACAGGADGYPPVYAEVINTPSGPFVSGTGVPYGAYVSEVVVPDPNGEASSHYTVFVNQYGVEVTERRGERYRMTGVRRMDGEIQYYEYFPGANCDYGTLYAISLTNPGPPTRYEDSEC